MINQFEKAFYDYLKGDKEAKIVVNINKFEADDIPISYFFRSFAEMPLLEQKALDLCSGKILDIGAGSGIHSLHLQSFGKDITALDIQSGFVDIMKKRGLKKVIHSDIFDYNQEKFDTLLMLMNGIGFTKNFKGLESFFNSAKRLLNPGGQIILDSSDLLYLYEEEDGTYTLNLNDEYYGEVEYQIEYEGVKDEPFRWLYSDYYNLSQYAEQAGFNCEKIYEDDHYCYLAKLTLPF